MIALHLAMLWVVATGFLLVTCAQTAHAHDDQAAPAEWISFAVLIGLVVAFIVVAAIAQARNVNPHTRLPSRIKRRRYRRDLTRRRP